MSVPITTLMDRRVPQPGEEDAYGVPAYLVEAAAVLYRHRNTAPDADVTVIDGAILRLYTPYLRPGRGDGDAAPTGDLGHPRRGRRGETP